MAKLLWEWKPRFAVALVVRDLLIVTSHTNCDVTSGPVVMRRYANADGDEQRYKTSKRKFLLLFVNCDRGRIEIDHLYGLCCRGWYCNPEQHSLCRPARRRPAQLVLFRIAVPTTPAQTVSWSIPITMNDVDKIIHYQNTTVGTLHIIWVHRRKVRAQDPTHASGCSVGVDWRAMCVILRPVYGADSVLFAPTHSRINLGLSIFENEFWYFIQPFCNIWHLKTYKPKIKLSNISFVTEIYKNITS